MKKILSALCALGFIISAALPCSAYSQHDIYTSADKALSWLVKNASPLKTPDSVASDYGVMALSKLNKSFDYNTYLSYTQSRNPSTDKDGQRLIMVETACGSVVSDAFVKIYTYNKLRDNASDLSGAIITLDCGAYELKSSSYGMDYMVMSLLGMQQSDGSFARDVYTTARSVIALAPYMNREYSVQGAHENETYSYSVETGILNAVSYLENAKNADYGYETITNTAYVIMALDSIGINAESDPGFTDGVTSPLTWIMSHQAEDGSFDSSADDTAIAACALTSHLRAMQGKSRFFDFVSSDTINSTTPDTASQSFGSVNTESQRDTVTAPPGKDNDKSQNKSNSSDKAVVKLTPPPTKAPEHSDMDAEEYGPIAPMGPVAPDMTPAPDTKKTAPAPASQPQSHGIKTAFVIIVAILALAGGAMLFIRLKYPEALFGKDTTKSEAKKEVKGNSAPSILNETDKNKPVVSTEELYDPDFVKKLIPVKHLEDTDTQSEENYNS